MDRVYHRNIIETLVRRLAEPRRFIQALVGPRQVGKTTLAHQAIASSGLPFHYATADDPALKDRAWIEQQWNIARLKATSEPALFVLDEAQKLGDWDEIVKKLWDEDTRTNTFLHVMLLGSSPLLVQKGLSESLAGRFEIMPVSHWSFKEMRDAFGYSVDEYIFFGGYPGSAGIRGDLERWRAYIRDSLIETTISRDILLVNSIDKPALMRRVFDLGCTYSAQELSYQKMLGQLQDAGNTTTIAHYLGLLEQVGLIAGIDKYAGQKVRQRASSPKLLVFNTSLITSGESSGLDQLKASPEMWGRLVESAIGAHLINHRIGGRYSLCYWRNGKREVDFVLQGAGKLVALEVKSRSKKTTHPGLEAFQTEFKGVVENIKTYLVGEGGIPINEFLLMDPMQLF